MMHDDGCIIKGQHAYVPEGYKMQHATTCESCDWYNMGVIDENFDIVERLRLNYDLYGGGFTFGHYVDTLTDTLGNPLENEALDNWLGELTNEVDPNEAEEAFLERTTLTVKPILVNDLTGEEEPFGDETGTPQFYMVKHTLEKYLQDEDMYIYTHDANPEWWFTIAQRRANVSAIGVREKIKNYIAIIEEIYEVNTLAPLWPEHCPSSHIKFVILN
jgi:predicted DNA-binding protein